MTSELHTPLCDFLGIEYPIVLAGMAAGGQNQETAPTPVKLVAAISDAGGLGVMGDNFRNLDELDAGIREVRSLVGDRPFGVDFLLPATRAEVTSTSKHEVYADIRQEYPKHVAVVEELIIEHGLQRAELSTSEPMTTDLLNRKIDVLLDNKVDVFAAALALGAQGAWVGTTFLTSEETNIPEEHQHQILGGRSDQFTLSKFHSGKQQRSYHNVVKEAWAESGLEPLEMPLQGIVQEPFTQAARMSGRFDLIGNPSGQISGMLDTRRPAGEILRDMVDEAKVTIEGIYPLIS